LAAAALAAAVSPSQAMPVLQPATDSSMIIHVANGCGPGWYRGPGGACHRFGFGPYPDGYYSHPAGWYASPAYGQGGCPAGWWGGRWGHGRNTPFHGRLPNGMWQ